MKKLYSLFAAVVVAVAVNAQTVIYSENMGTATSTTAISANAFQNGSPITYSGTADVRATSPSSTTNYAEASGGANVMINASGEYFQISGIDTSSYENINLYLGQRKGTTAGNNELTIEVSADGTNWTALSYTRTTGTGTATWAYINPTGTIPSTSNLSIRFTGTNTIEWRVDDVKLTGTAIALGVTDINKTKKSLLKFTSVTNELIFAAKSDVKVYNVNGQIVKSASVNENTSLNVSTWPKGIYIVSGNVDGEAVSQKIIKK